MMSSEKKIKTWSSFKIYYLSYLFDKVYYNAKLFQELIRKVGYFNCLFQCVVRLVKNVLKSILINDKSNPNFNDFN